jgi:dephospho-CoA kinase
MKVIGITGGVATGKTTVARFLSSMLKAEMIDADKIAHELLLPSEKVGQKVIQFFGEDVLKNGSSIERKKLGQIIFGNISKRKKLESIIHPAVKKIIKEKLEQYRDSGKKWVVMDIPLLFEAKMESMVDRIIVVIRDESAQLDTLHKEKGLSLREARERIESQLSLPEKVKHAHFVVDNNGTLSDTERQVRDIYARLRIEDS